MRMPAWFFDHGSPMSALEDNSVTRAWAEIAQAAPRPRAVLCISAHWLTRGSAITAMRRPRTIHDFGASFPKALFDMQYPAPGDPDLATRVRDLLGPTPVVLDEHAWGLDHGAWSVLCKAYPAADVPVVQLSLDAELSPAEHFDRGRRLASLRDEGVLILGTGNIVHNLPRMDWGARTREPYPWAANFNRAVRTAIAEDVPAGVIDYSALGEAAKLSVPTPEHYWPLLYVLGARGVDDTATLGPDLIEHGSLSMSTVVLAPPRLAA